MRVSLPMDKPANARTSSVGRPNYPRTLVLLALPFALVAGAYWFYMSDAARSQPSPAFQTVAASKGALVSTLPTTGSAVSARQAQLGFGRDGRIMELNVAVGDAVKAGQPLAKLDTRDLEIKVAQAESALKVSQLRLEQLRQGISAEEEAAARTAVGAALARYQEVSAGPAEDELQAARATVEHATVAVIAAEATFGQLKRGPTGAEIAAAQAEVDRAAATLTSAEARLRQLEAGPLQEELGTALAALAAAQAKLAGAEARLQRLQATPTQAELTSAQAMVDEARAALTSAEDRYHIAVNGDPKAAGGTSVPALQQALEAAKTNFDAAVQRLALLRAGPTAQEIQAAERELESARQTVAVAAARVEQARKGPLPSDVAASRQAVDAARASLSSAQARLELLKAGPSEANVLAAESALAGARADLAAAQARWDDLQKGPRAAEVEAARSSLATAEARLALATAGPSDTELAIAAEQVTQAEIALQETRLALQNSVLAAPFDGIVAAIKANVGEQISNSGPAVVLVDPAAVRIEATVEESDVIKLAPGQRAMVSLGALGEQNLPSRVIAVSPIGTRQQKAATYLVSIGIDSPDHTVPLGMSARVSIETERKENVLLVPNSAIRGQGINRTVQVMVDRKPQERTVQTGSSDGQFTEIVSGLSEGELVVIRTSYPDAAR